MSTNNSLFHMAPASHQVRQLGHERMCNSSFRSLCKWSVFPPKKAEVVPILVYTVYHNMKPHVKTNVNQQHSFSHGSYFEFYAQNKIYIS